MNRRWSPLSSLAGAVTVVAVAAGCAAPSPLPPAAVAATQAASATSIAAAPAGGPCPVTPLKVVAAENWYGNLAQQYGGQCVQVTSVITDPNTDPHDFEPTAATAATYSGADIVIQNGLDYDPWSAKLLMTVNPKPAVITMGDVVGKQDGDNPHIWYGPDYVKQMTAALTAGFSKARPSAASYFQQQGAAADTAMKPYYDLVQTVKTRFAGQPVGSTESIFEYMADATGLKLETPVKLMDAVSENNEPTAADVTAMQNQIRNKQIRSLVYNTQTSSGLTESWYRLAVQNNVPIVGVTETMVPATGSFQDWQGRQLQALIAALGR